MDPKPITFDVSDRFGEPAHHRRAAYFAPGGPA